MNRKTNAIVFASLNVGLNIDDYQINVYFCLVGNKPK